jgi:non-heme chloroperoxidase
MKTQFEGKFRTSDTQSIYYTTNFGDQLIETERTCLVFNNGLACSWDHWKFQLPFFHLKNYPILIHDYRNHFRSTGKVNYHKINFHQIATDLYELMDHLKIRKCIMIGHSMGVNVSIIFAQNYPEFIKGLVLVSGTLISPLKTMLYPNIMKKVFPIAKQLAHQFPFATQLVWDLSPDLYLWKKFIHHSGFNEDQVTLSDVEIYLQKIRLLDVKLFFHLFELMNNEIVQKSLKKIYSPALVISGEKDKIIPNYIQEKLLEKIPFHEFYILKNGSHVPQMDFPDLINERIFQFISKIEEL